MKHEKAWQIAASWGVALTGYEKGAVFYSLSGKSDQIADEEHRAKLLSYTEDCLIEAKSRIIEGSEAPDQVDARKDLADLEALKVYFERTPAADAPDQFLIDYLTAALWLLPEPDEDDDYDLDSFSYSDLPVNVIEAARKDCVKFQTENAALLAQLEALPKHQSAGHDFFLTRNGHGAGFWDRGYPEDLGEALSEASRKFGEADLLHEDGAFFYS